MRLQSGIPVVSIAVASIAEVTIAAGSIAEPHHVMQLQCWEGFKQKFSFVLTRKFCKKFLLAFCSHPTLVFAKKRI
jgi:hypothetical protein